jgi:diguanylate cyclase (GGDEF)-like protein
MLWVSWLLLRPNAFGRRWRWLAGAALLSSGAMVVGRLALVLFAPESYPKFESSHWINILGLVVSNANLTVGTLAFLLAHRDEAEQELLRLATVDGLTGVLNRRRLLEQATHHHQLALRHARPMALVMLDIDHFKRINDQHGHPVGDRALGLFAQALQQTVRQPDLVGRYGGEEFCIVLPLSGADAAQAVDQRLREAVRRDVVPALGFDMTFSAGVALARPDDQGLDDLIGRADRALYEAKQGGRNRLVADEGTNYRRPGPNAAHQSARAQASTMAT